MHTLVSDKNTRTWQRNCRIAVSVQGDDRSLSTTCNAMEETGHMTNVIVG